MGHHMNLLSTRGKGLLFLHWDKGGLKLVEAGDRRSRPVVHISTVK